MLFNSCRFIFEFLPITFFLFFLLGKKRHDFALLCLAAASIIFYGSWNAPFTILLLGSILFNFIAALCISKSSTSNHPKQSKIILILSILSNILLLGYFKYANFFIQSLNDIAGTDIPIGSYVLPLGISFFTFTQIAFLVDTFQGKVREHNFLQYVLFVTYFPHLIAGPVLHHKEMMPQFAKRIVCAINMKHISAGLTLFILGLAKKVILADTLSGFGSPVFDAVAAGGVPMFLEAWVGALSYTLQLYFDFSGYSDMAIGLSLMFNVRLPMNFNSPYKATNIIDFWRRWHMTLSRFLRDYLYITLGGNRKGKAMRYINLMLTMLLGGLWHGAGWTFVIWGGLHGFYLMINHAWRGIYSQKSRSVHSPLSRFGSTLLTFFAVVIGWVFFRANSFSSAWTIINGLIGLNGISVHQSLAKFLSHAPIDVQFNGFTPLSYVNMPFGTAMILIGLIIALTFPNTSQIMRRIRPTLENLNNSNNSKDDFLSSSKSKLQRWLEWRPSTQQAVIYGIIFFILLAYLAASSKSEFLYFQF